MPHGSATTAPNTLGFPTAPFHDPFHACCSAVTVGIATAPATNTAPSADSPVEIIDGQRVVTLSAARLARLLEETRAEPPDQASTSR